MWYLMMVESQRFFEDTPFIPSRKADLRQTLIAIQRAMVLIPTIDIVIRKLIFY